MQAEMHIDPTYLIFTISYLWLELGNTHQ